MTTVDIILLSLLGVAALLGFRQGLVLQISRFLLLWFALWLGIRYAEPMSRLLSNGFGVEAADSIYVALGCNALLALVVALFASRLLRGVVRFLHFGLLDSLLGAFFAIFSMAIVLSLALFLFHRGGAQAPLPAQAEGKVAQRGPIERSLGRLAPAIYPTLKHYAAASVQLLRDEYESLPKNDAR